MTDVLRRREARSARIAAHCAARALAILWLATGAAKAEPGTPDAAPALPSVLEPGATVPRSTIPVGGVHFTLALSAGQFVELTIVQVSGAVELLLEDDRGLSVPMRTEAGIGGRVQVPLTAATAATWRVTLTPRKSVPATIDLAVDAPRAAEARDRERAAAFVDFARAESLRRAHYRETVIAERTPDIDAKTRAAYDTAAAEYASAADDCGLRRVRIGRARMEVSVGDYRAARESIDAALASACVGDAADEAQAYKTLGMAAAYQGDFQDSVAAAEHALALYRATGDRLYQGVVLGNLSSVYLEMGAADRALAAARGALEAAAATGDAQGVVYSRKSIAAIYLGEGELAEALAVYRETLADLARTPYPLIEGEVWNDLGTLYHRMGDYASSLREYDRAQAVWSKMQYATGIADTTLAQGEVLLDRRSRREATTAFRRALDVARAGGLKSPEVRALRDLGVASVEAGDWAGARQNLEASRDLAHTLAATVDEARAVQGLGDLARRRGDPGAARSHYLSALALVRQAADLGGEAATLSRLAAVASDTGDPEGGLQAIEQALDIIERQRGRINDPGLRTSYFASLRAYHDLHVDILMRLDAGHPGQGYAAAGLAAAELARARVLQDTLAERSIGPGRGADPELRQRLRVAEESVRVAALAVARLPAGAPAERRLSLQAAVDAASRALDEARGRLRAAEPRAAELARPRPLELAELQSRLVEPDGAILEFWLGRRQSYRWLVTKHALKVRRLPGRAEIERRALGLRQRLRQRPPAAAAGGFAALAQQHAELAASIDREAEALGAILLGADIDRLPQRQLAIVADGELQLVPFGLLRPAAGADRLGAGHDLSYLPSISTLAWLRRTAAPRFRGASVAIFADPVFSAADERRPAEVAELSRGLEPDETFDIRALPRLAASRAEAESIVELLPKGRARAFLGTAASRTEFLRTDWRQYAIAHVAAHSLVDVRRPELSGIVLSLFDAAGRPVDGFVRMNDIYGLEMPVELVVLSACDSGVGKGVNAEGIFSLGRAFLYAGAPRVVVSLWAVDDRATAAFMASFYRALLGGERSVAAALRVAQTAMSADPRWRNPYYWAGFVLQGDGH